MGWNYGIRYQLHVELPDGSCVPGDRAQVRQKSPVLSVWGHQSQDPTLVGQRLNRPAKHFCYLSFTHTKKQKQEITPILLEENPCVFICHR